MAGNLALLIAACCGRCGPIRCASPWDAWRPDAFLDKYSDRYVFWHEANQAVPPSPVRSLVLEKIPHPYYIERPFVLLSYLEQGTRRLSHVNTLPGRSST